MGSTYVAIVKYTVFVTRVLSNLVIKVCKNTNFAFASKTCDFCFGRVVE